MAKIDCAGGDDSVPCMCDCGHASTWHRVFKRWMARCLVAGCPCEWNDVCGCVDGYNSDNSNSFLVALGIAKGDAWVD